VVDQFKTVVNARRDNGSSIQEKRRSARLKTDRLIRMLEMMIPNMAHQSRTGKITTVIPRNLLLLSQTKAVDEKKAPGVRTESDRGATA
jgi:hypothetical protein